MSAKKKITKRLVESLDPGSLIWDTEVRGFGIRRQRRDPVYILKATVKKRQRWITIGPHNAPWVPETARTEAKRLLGLIASGQDPAEDRDRGKVQPTMNELADRYISEYAAEHKKPVSISEDKRNLKNHILPMLGKRLVVDVSHGDISTLARAVRNGKTNGRGGPISANRVLALTSKMMSLAESWGIAPRHSNPCLDVPRYRETARERFLSDDELRCLFDALREAEPVSPAAVATIRLLVLTGCRRGEILNLRWDEVDLGRGLLMLGDTKTGRRAVHLSPPAQEILAGLPRMANSPFVIAGSRPGRPFRGLARPWNKIRDRTGLNGVRIHDLRHSFASLAAAGGASLLLIGKLLGHSNQATTARYAHLSADPLRAVNDAVGGRLAALDKPVESGAEIVPLRRNPEQEAG